MNVILRNKKAILLIFLYVFVLSGGLWHVLERYQATMQVLAGPVMILLALITIFDMYQTITKTKRRLFILWAITVTVAGFLVEWAGVQSGEIFGEYEYGGILQPSIGSVPVAIGFAWTLMAISSFSLALAITRKLPYGRATSLFRTFLTAAFMVLFDFLMEPAATQLGYWQWLESSIPLQNYSSWFSFGFLFSLPLVSLVQSERLPKLALHLYIIQCLYFAIILLGS